MRCETLTAHHHTITPLQKTAQHRQQARTMKQNCRIETVLQRVLPVLPGVQEALQKLEHQIVVLQTQRVQHQNTVHFQMDCSHVKL